MGLKTLIKMLAALAGCAVVFGIVKCSSDSQGVSTVSSSETKKKVFESFPVNEISELKITEKDNTVTLKKGEEFWEVVERDGYRADTSKVANLIRSVWDLEIAQPVPMQRNHYKRVGLGDPKEEGVTGDEAATILSFKKSGEGEAPSLWLGKVAEASEGRANPFGGGMMMSDVGRYVKQGNKNFVYIVGETFRDAEAEPSNWLNDEFFEVSKIKKISRKTKTPEEDWSLSREELSGDFVLEGAKEGEELDPTKVTSMKSAFSSPRFEDVLVGDDAKEPEASVFTVETFDGFTYVIAAGEKNDLNELPLTVKVSAKFPEKREEGEEESDEEKKKADEEFAKDIQERKDKLAKEKKLEGRVFKVRSFVVDSISKTRTELLKEKEEETPEKNPENTEKNPENTDSNPDGKDQ